MVISRQFFNTSKYIKSDPAFSAGSANLVGETKVDSGDPFVPGDVRKRSLSLANYFSLDGPASATTDIMIAQLSVRVNPSNPNHHLWNNNGTWFIHYVVHPTPYTKERVRRSLRTKCLQEARARRDEVLAYSGEEAA